MIETSNEQIIDQNHDHDHDYDHIISKKKKNISNRETGE